MESRVADGLTQFGVTEIAGEKVRAEGPSRMKTVYQISCDVRGNYWQALDV